MFTRVLGVAILTAAARAQHVELCTHGSEVCAPVSEGILFAAIFPFIIVFFLALYVPSVYFCMKENDIRCCDLCGRLRCNINNNSRNAAQARNRPLLPVIQTNNPSIRTFYQPTDGAAAGQRPTPVAPIGSMRRVALSAHHSSSKLRNNVSISNAEVELATVNPLPTVQRVASGRPIARTPPPLRSASARTRVQTKINPQQSLPTINRRGPLPIEATQFEATNPLLVTQRARATVSPLAVGATASSRPSPAATSTATTATPQLRSFSSIGVVSQAPQPRTNVAIRSASRPLLSRSPTAAGQSVELATRSFRSSSRRV